MINFKRFNSEFNDDLNYQNIVKFGKTNADVYKTETKQFPNTVSPKLGWLGMRFV